MSDQTTIPDQKATSELVKSGVITEQQKAEIEKLPEPAYDYKSFNWINWLVALSRLFSLVTIFYFIAKIGTQNGIFDGVVMKTVAVIGFVGYIVTIGVRLLRRGSPEFWIHYTTEKKE